MGAKLIDRISPVTAAVFAGSLGALAASCGKLTGSVPQGSWGLLLCLALWALLLVANATSTTFFLSSMRRLPSLHATVLSLAANIIMAGGIGWAAWSEDLTASWLLGASCIVAGVGLISHSASNPHSKTAKSE